MRDIIVITIVFVGCLVALRRPWIGVMLWTWLSVMTPHEMAFGFSRSFPVAAMAAGATIIGLMFEKDRSSPFGETAVSLLAIFTTWICITYPFSFNVEGSTQMLTKVLKINFMIFVTLMLLKTRKQIEYFIWVLVFSIGFFAIKGGVFTLSTGGSYQVLGPGGFIGGNNEMALAIITIIPLMRFLQLQQHKIWIRNTFTAVILLSVTSALGSQSRGALLAVAGIIFFMWTKSHKKLIFAVVLVIFAVLLLGFMPDSWNARMNTISEYQDDQSAMGRINAWRMAWNLASHNFFGGGFDIYNVETFSLYAPDPTDIHAAHSIYFQILGEHGFVGLFIYILLWLFSWKTARDLINEKRIHPELNWCRDIGAMCQVSLLGFFVGGAFLSLAYFDLPYDILVIVVLTKRWMKNKIIALYNISPEPDKYKNMKISLNNN